MANIIIDYSLKENVFKDNDFVFSDLKMPMTIDYKNREYKIDLNSNRFFSTYFTYNLSFYYNFIDISNYSQ